MLTDNASSTALECLRGDMIVKLGIGGYIPADDILLHFNPITAEQFAKIIYATDLMPYIFEDPAEANNVENIEAVINQINFELKPHFKQLVDMFKSRFGNQAQFTFG